MSLISCGITRHHLTLRRVIPVECVTNEREESVVNQNNQSERCYILIIKLHISAYNVHRQVSIPIKKSLYICVRVC